MQQTANVARVPMGAVIDTVTAYLRAHGPATVKELAAAVGAREASVNSALRRHRGLFHVVGAKVNGGQRGAPEKVWSLTSTPVAASEPTPRDQLLWRACAVAAVGDLFACEQKLAAAERALAVYAQPPAVTPFPWVSA